MGPIGTAALGIGTGLAESSGRQRRKTQDHAQQDVLGHAQALAAGKDGWRFARNTDDESRSGIAGHGEFPA